MDEDQGPSRIVPGTTSKKTIGDRIRSIKRAFFTKEGLIGTYDYAFLFTPNIPFMKRSRHSSPFFGLNDRMPVLLALLLGFQHALGMLAGVITPPLLISGAAGANLDPELQQYLVSTALIVSGTLSMIQITRFHIYKTPYYIGTGLLSVAGISFSIIPVAQGALDQMYNNGFCPVGADGAKLPCPDGYGAILGTGAITAILIIILAFIPPRILLRIFPPIVTGPTVLLMGVKLIQSGFRNWMGGTGPCSSPSTAVGFFERCPNIAAPNALPWGSPEYFGLGFSVFVTIILSERFGSPIMKSCSVIVGLLVGCIIAASTGYFDRSGIDNAPVALFIWVHTFKLTLYGPLVLPLMAVYIICATEAIGDITATCDVSRVEVHGQTYESRIQGGVLADGLNGILASLMTLTPVTTFSQNNGIIALTRCASRAAGYCCCFFLIIMGIFSKFAASLISIPSPVLGGMTTFLFASVAVSGMAIINRGVVFNRRNRFILTAGFVFGYGGILLPGYFANVLPYDGDNTGLRGFLDAITLIVETGFAMTTIINMVLNLVLPEEIDETDAAPVPMEAVRPGGEGSARSTDSDDILPTRHDSTSKGEEKVY
ncbi:uric acid-xanthine permease [Sodiomyces alkalinus F11]|uniref:Uric acid-xanthine permease n=1 Tax=Sodiomyces alkalinus (strain CBS 110278 / VKM F-3762 / F11) TaxID=1314773 RepID=A0A3N2PPX6_SODAK|nr:uric acid-xanthine permease [Sodiomyces alkalinus F11]ROT36557.1 uric acid-xanthine permease [Sodiomyces alkalinus F11]